MFYGHYDNQSALISTLRYIFRVGCLVSVYVLFVSPSGTIYHPLGQDMTQGQFLSGV